MASHHPIRKHVAPLPPVIPDKLYFRIGDVARLCDVPPYVLRFWETEFPQLKPNKGGTGQRLYRKREVEMALRIKSLLYDQGYTIPGARQVFKSESRIKEIPESPEAVLSPEIPQPEQATAPEPLPTVDIGAAIRQDAQHRQHLSALRDELRSIADLLGQGKPAPQAAAGQASPAAQPEPPHLVGNLKPMRPRLVLESKPRDFMHKESRPEPKLEPRLINQGDLFSSE